VGVELLNAERQTDMTKVIVVFRNFAKELKNSPVVDGCLQSAARFLFPEGYWPCAFHQHPNARDGQEGVATTVQTSLRVVYSFNLVRATFLPHMTPLIFSLSTRKFQKNICIMT